MLLDKPLKRKEFNDSISSLKPSKAAGYDDLNSNVVLHTLDSIKKPLFHIDKLSISQGVFPELLKVSKVTPIFKKDNALLVSNYRPISLIPILSFKSLRGLSIIEFILI